MYICRETVRNAVLRKFRTLPKFRTLSKFEELKGKIDNRDEANTIINSLKICDPAVGSGHFLVSVLNELIALKSELGILKYRNGNPIRDYKIEVENDELIISDKITENLFSYQLNEKGNPIDYLQELQEAIFHEKQTIIENCLFGVDINANSVNICNLRLWIELLKHSYYIRRDEPSRDEPSGTSGTAGTSPQLELQTLPNIDINIKQGNSLISRFSLNGGGFANGQAQKMRLATNKYKEQVILYKATNDKKTKQNAEQQISKIKKEFANIVNPHDAEFKKLRELKAELANIQSQSPVLMTDEDRENWQQQLKALPEEISKLEYIYEENLNSLYSNAFEWRFEFPEVLDTNGNFIGFDVIIGNPPYINFAYLRDKEREFYKKNFDIYKNKTDLYAFFVSQAIKITKADKNICLITPHTWLGTTSFEPLRNALIGDNLIKRIVELNFGVFKEAVVKTAILHLNKSNQKEIEIYNEDFSFRSKIPIEIIKNDSEQKIKLDWSSEKQKIYDKLQKETTILGEVIRFTRGIKTSNDKRFVLKKSKNKDCKKVIRGRNIKAYKIDYAGEYVWYRPDLMKEKAGCLPHSSDLFEVPEKLIIQRVNSSGQLLGTYDNTQIYTLDTTNISDYRNYKNKKFKLKYILALINSNLINWWFNDNFKMPTISGYELHQIPLKYCDTDKQNEIIKIVDEILTIKKENPQAITIDLEKKIDEIIFSLYKITKKEHLIISSN